MRQPWRKCWVARRQRGFAVFPRPNPAILHPGCPHSRRTGRGTVRGWPVQLPSKSIVALSLCEFAERVAVLLHDFAGNLHLLRELRILACYAKAIGRIRNENCVASFNV